MANMLAIGNQVDLRLTWLPNLGPATEALYRSIGIASLPDLVLHVPRRHVVPAPRVTVKDLVAGGRFAVVARVEQTSASRRRGRAYTKITAADASGRFEVFFFGQPHLRSTFGKGQSFLFQGVVKRYQDRLVMGSPYCEAVDASAAEPSVPLLAEYHLPRGVSQRRHRAHVKHALDRLRTVPAFLPETLSALERVHLPATLDAARAARRELGLAELLVIATRRVEQKRRRSGERAALVLAQPPAVGEVAAMFPFPLTRAQHECVAEVLGDLAGPSPMHRLLQGDVGSGKTAVALAALLALARDGMQGVLMAPTDVLAAQQERSLSALRVPFALRSVLLTGGLPRAEAQARLRDIESGAAQIVFGTHALLEQRVRFRQLALVVIDEQHKFGVRQRALLRDKATQPHVLVMTATPIPRTLTLTLFGDLDVSILGERPASRGTVTTHVCTTKGWTRVLDHIRAEAAAGRSTFVVCPRVENEAGEDIHAVLEVHARLERELQPLRVDLLHGRMPSERKLQVLEEFAAGAGRVLCTTVVVEVGVHVPRATTMVVLDADRFGLAQLHQMRGRIGRDADHGTCFLLAEPRTAVARARLKTMVATTDGFRIAEEDLRLRGPGEPFGLPQHGCPKLRFAHYVHDADLVLRAFREARAGCRADPGMAAHCAAETDLVAAPLG